MLISMLKHAALCPQSTLSAVVSQFDLEKNVIKLKFGRNIQKYVYNTSKSPRIPREKTEISTILFNMAEIRGPKKFFLQKGACLGLF